MSEAIQGRHDGEINYKRSIRPLDLDAGFTADGGLWGLGDRVHAQVLCDRAQLRVVGSMFHSVEEQYTSIYHQPPVTQTTPRLN